MTLLKTIFAFSVLLFASAFMSEEAYAHAGHSHEPATSIEQGEKSSSHDQTDNHHTQLNADEKTGLGLDPVCLHGCCVGVCAACCVVYAETNAEIADFFPPMNLLAWRHYQTPDDAISLPDTPPPRV